MYDSMIADLMGHLLDMDEEIAIEILDSEGNLPT